MNDAVADQFHDGDTTFLPFLVTHGRPISDFAFMCESIMICCQTLAGLRAFRNASSKRVLSRSPTRASR